MKYAFTIPRYSNLSEDFLKQILPDYFDVAKDIENQNNLVVIVTSQQTDQDVLFEVQRELDRISFFIGHPIYPLKRYKERDDGLKENVFMMKTDLRLLGPVPDKLGRQVWDSSLSVQLCLWRLFRLEGISYQAKINLLYQIIEIANQKQLQKYDDATVAPSPHMEAKLLRDLVSHGKFNRGIFPSVKTYCKFLGISEKAHDPTNFNEVNKIKGRISIVEKEAEKAIKDQITYC